MKKIFFLLSMLAAVTLSGCNKDENPVEPGTPAEPTALVKPEPKAEEITPNSALIIWAAVEHAQSYAYYMGTETEEDARTVSETQIQLNELEPETEYTVRVRALAGTDTTYLDSEWGEVTFTTAELAMPEPESYTVYAMDPFVIMYEANLATSYVRNLSPSGNYAVGFDDQMGDPTSFVWDRSTGEFTILDPGEYDGCIAYDVNDNGVIVGSVVTGGYEKMPAYMDFKNGGTWVLLPTNGQTSSAFPSYAVAITNDGLIGGQVLTELPDGSMRCVPCLWNNYQLDQSAFDLPEDGDEACQIGSFVYGMSDDGRVMVGWQDWGVGSRSPAVWVDGRLTRIYGEEPIVDDEGMVFDGVAWSVSADGTKVTGYWAPDGMSLTGFIYDMATGEKTEIPGYGGVAFDAFGRVYFTGSMGIGGLVWENGSTTDVYDLWADMEGTFVTEISPEVGADGMPSAIYAISDDGMVMGGSYTYSTFGTILQYPSIVVME